MIFGKAHLQFQTPTERSHEQKKLHAKCYGIKKFAWLPVLINTGRYAWLVPYYRYYHTTYIEQTNHDRVYAPVMCLGSHVSVNYLTHSIDNVTLVEKYERK